MAGRKGGSGKTAVAVNLGAALAHRGRTVLIVDCDPQGSAADALGVSRVKPTLAETLMESTPALDAVRPTGFHGLSLLPADLDLAIFESDPPPIRRASERLRAVVASLAVQYDTVLLDSAPGLGRLPRMTVFAASAVIVVCPPEFLGPGGVDQISQALERLESGAARNKLRGIVPTLTTHRTSHEREALAEVRRQYPTLVLTDIPRRLAVAAAQVAGQPVSVFAPGSDATHAFNRLATEVIARI